MPCTHRMTVFILVAAQAVAAVVLGYALAVPTVGVLSQLGVVSVPSVRQAFGIGLILVCGSPLGGCDPGRPSPHHRPAHRDPRPVRVRRIPIRPRGRCARGGARGPSTCVGR